MKKLVLAAVLLSAFAVAQQQTPAAPPPETRAAAQTANITGHTIPATRSDIYCSGFLSKDAVPHANVVAGGLETPEKVRFAEHDFIFITGPAVQPGSLVSIVREWQNPDKLETFKQASKLLKEAGQPYQDMGYARVVETRGETAVAQVEFSCDGIIPGDLAIPYVQRPDVNVRHRLTFDRFPAEINSLTGRIVMASDGDQVIATGTKVFLNIGSDKGIRVGDYFRVTRDYTVDEMDPADRASTKSTEYDDTQKKPKRLPAKEYGKLPRRVLGEIVILNSLPTTATAMVTFMLEEMHPGDVVDKETAEVTAAGGSN